MNIKVPLRVLESPYRDISMPLIKYIKKRRARARLRGRHRLHAAVHRRPLVGDVPAQPHGPPHPAQAGARARRRHRARAVAARLVDPHLRPPLAAAARPGPPRRAGASGAAQADAARVADLGQEARVDRASGDRDGDVLAVLVGGLVGTGAAARHRCAAAARRRRLPAGRRCSSTSPARSRSGCWWRGSGRSRRTGCAPVSAPGLLGIVHDILRRSSLRRSLLTVHGQPRARAALRRSSRWSAGIARRVRSALRLGRRPPRRQIGPEE